LDYESKDEESRTGIAKLLTADNEEWKLASWESHFGIIEAGADTNINDGDIQRLWVKIDGSVIKIVK
jgi:hypothetical protein